MSLIREQIKLAAGQSFRLLRWQRNLRDVEWLLSPRRSERFGGEGAHWHYHEACELTFFTTGEGTRFVGDQIQPFHGGDLVLLGENLPHYWHTHGLSSGWSIQWHFPADHPFWSLPESRAIEPLLRSAARGVQFRAPTAAIVAPLFPQLAAADGLDRLALVLRVLAVAANAPPRERSFISADAFALAVESRHQVAMRDAIRFLLANFRGAIRLSDVLAAAHMSKPTFARQFKKHSGRTLGEFLQQVRLDAACRELAESDRPVTEVALGCGFTQISFFNRLFRRARHCSPTDYRHRRHRALRRMPVTPPPADQADSCG